MSTPKDRIYSRGLAMRIILLGPPGAGKGTQAQYICQHFKIPQISTGNMLRTAIEEGNPIGLEAKAVMDAGHLVSDEIIIKLVKDRIAQPDCKLGFLFDGFPRTIPQAEATTAAGITLDFVVNIIISDEAIVERLSGRYIHLPSGRTYHKIYHPPKLAGKDDVTGEALTQRVDDEETTVRDRLQVYQNQTRPLVEYYQTLSAKNGKPEYHEVDGTQSVDAIRAQMFSILNS